MSNAENPFEMLAELDDGGAEENPFESLFAEASDEKVENLFKAEGAESSGKEKDEKASEPKIDEAVENPLVEAMEQQEQAGIFTKLPVFKYGSAEEPIEDTKQTFEELRAAKEGDFPELEDAKRVTWVVTYGKIVKNVYAADAKKKKIGDFKREIETSKEFTTALKKAKDKSPTCEIKPRVTAQSKGERMPVYKGVFTDIEQADDSGKLICLVPGNDGKVYEIRNEEMGRFITTAGRTDGLSEIRAGFTPALPLIPREMLLQIISFFRSFLREDGSFEAIANILWDRCDQTFVVAVPKQSVAHAKARSDLSEGFDTERYLHYMDIHSHNVMNAKFSYIDDLDERATRLYAVVGRMDNYFPRVKVRISNGGKFHEIEPDLVFEAFNSEYPEEWNAQVTIEGIRCAA